MKFRKDEGFTLVELMVVVLIIGILIAVAVPVFNTARANAQKRTCQANQRTLEGAYQTWYADNEDPSVIPAAATGAAFTVATNLLVPNMVKAIPVCKAWTTGQAYTVDVGTAGLTIDILCPVANHVN